MNSGAVTADAKFGEDGSRGGHADCGRHWRDENRLAIYSNESGPHTPLASTEVRSADYPSLQAMVSEFLGQVKMSVDVASFDVAGPVIDGHVKTTNLPG